jgi:hypothetical protein
VDGQVFADYRRRVHFEECFCGIVAGVLENDYDALDQTARNKWYGTRTGSSSRMLISKIGQVPDFASNDEPAVTRPVMLQDILDGQ